MVLFCLQKEGEEVRLCLHMEGGSLLSSPSLQDDKKKGKKGKKKGKKGKEKGKKKGKKGKKGKGDNVSRWQGCLQCQGVIFELLCNVGGRGRV